MKIHLIRKLATVALLIGIIFSTQAQDWSSMNMVINSNHGNNNCHRVDRNYNFSYSIQLPPPTSVTNSCGGEDTEEYTLVPFGGNDPVVVFDANGQNSLYEVFQRKSSIDKGSSLNNIFTARYDDAWRATKMSFTLVAHVRYLEKRTCENSAGQTVTDVLTDRVFARYVTVDFTIGRYFEAPSSVIINGLPRNVINVDPTRGCSSYTLTAPSVNHVDEYRWILPDASWLISGTASLNTRTITIQPSHSGVNLGDIQLEVIQECDGPRAKRTTIPVRGSIPSISLIEPVACPSNYITEASLPQLSPGVSANWQVDGSRIQIISTQNNTVRFRARGNYQTTTTIRATIQSACGSTTTASKTIWLGKPRQPTTNPSGYPTIPVALNSFVNLLVDNGNPLEAASYQWWTTSNGIRMQPSGSFCKIWGDVTGHHNYYVTRNNVCGASIAGGGAVRVGRALGGGPGGGGGVFSGPRNSSLSDLNPEARITRLMLTPNPANDVVNLTFQDDAGDLIDWAGMQAALLDVSGRQIATIQSATYDISNLAAGVYFIQIDTPRGKLVEKLIVQ